MFLRARWEGNPPQVGEFLMSQVRPRFAYRIDEVDVRQAANLNQLPHGLSGSHRDAQSKLLLRVTKVPIAEIPAGAVTHPWKWDARKKTGVAWSAAS